MIESRSHQLRDGLGWDAACYVEESDGKGITITPFFLTDVFPTKGEAIRAAFHAGQKKIDSGFEHNFVVEPVIPGMIQSNEH